MSWNEDHTAIVYFDDSPEHEFLSNFYEGTPFKWTSSQGHLPGETTVRTGEHAFQAEKAVRRNDYVKIITASSPGLAKRLGRRCTMRDDWDDVKMLVMRDVIRAKFAPGTEEARMLLDTGDVHLEEGNVWHDQIWGNCICGGPRCASRGQNLLGQCLMGQRNELLLRMEGC